MVLTVVAAAAVILAAVLGFQVWREAQNKFLSRVIAPKLRSTFTGCHANETASPER